MTAIDLPPRAVPASLAAAGCVTRRGHTMRSSCGRRLVSHGEVTSAAGRARVPRPTIAAATVKELRSFERHPNTD